MFINQDNNKLKLECSTLEYAISQGWVNCQDIETIDKVRTIKNIVVTYDKTNATITNIELPKISKETKKSWKGFTKKNFLKFLENLINKYDLKIQILDQNNNTIYDLTTTTNKELSTPNILVQITQGEEKHMKLIDFYRTKKNDINNLITILKNIAPHVYNDKLAGYSQADLEKYIKNNSQEIITYIDGAKLSMPEDRGFCAARFLAIEKFKKGFINSPDQKFEAKTSDIYKLAGVPYTKGEGYDTKQRLAIKNAITNPKGNLRKPIHVEYKQKHKDGNAILSTNFIQYAHWNDEENKVELQVDSLFFAFIPNQPDKAHYFDDIIGRNRLMNNTDGGFRNKKLYRLHKYLSSSLKKETTYNASTLLEESGLITYLKKGNKTLALSKLQEYLDLMYEQKTLLKNKPIKINSKSDEYGKYKLERL
jgi:hypothetical protein